MWLLAALACASIKDPPDGSRGGAARLLQPVQNQPPDGLSGGHFNFRGENRRVSICLKLPVSARVWECRSHVADRQHLAGVLRRPAILFPLRRVN